MRITVLAAALVAVLAAPAVLSAANGVKNKKTLLRGDVALDSAASGRCELTSEFESILFRLTSVENKYRLLRIRIVNRTSENLALSKTGDTVEVIFGSDRVNGVLDLAGHDEAFWSSLDPALREQIVYPHIVEKGGEEESVFVFIPGVSHETAPTAVVYKFASAPDTPVELRERAAVAH